MISGNNRTLSIMIAPGSREEEEDEEAHEAGGHGDVLATEGAQQWRADAKPESNSMCASGQPYCNNSEIKAEQRQRSIDAQLGIPCSCPYTTAPGNGPPKSINPTTGFDSSFLDNVQQADEFLHQGEQEIY